MQAVVSWSGGKDSCLSYYKAISQGIEVPYLVNFIGEEGPSHITHGADPKLIAMQAQALEVPMIQKKVQWETYEQGFKEIMQELKRKGIETGVFGDIDVHGHRQWTEKLCEGAGIKPIFPLCGEEPEQLMKDFIDAGFVAIVIGVKRDFLSRKWLGHKVDEEFINRLRQLRDKSGIHLCGANGEYHTFVIDGPIFKKRLKIPERKQIHREGCLWFLDISEYELVPK
jgi:uncharacterized protein (TIGR00290 family)